MKWSIGDGPVAIIAHRGDWAGSRENTLPAIVDAIRAGADVVEIDVKITADAEVILLHDDDLQRLWDGDDRRVSELAYAEVAAVAEASGGWRQIPTLTSALALTGGTGADLLIDIDANAAVEPAWRVVQSGVQEKLITSAEVIWCGRPEAMATLRSLDADARIVLSWDEASADGALPDAGLIESLAPEAFNPHWPMITEQTRGWARERELALSCWTVDQPDGAEHVLALGVDAIITNDVRMTRRAVDQHHRPSAR